MDTLKVERWGVENSLKGHKEIGFENVVFAVLAWGGGGLYFIHDNQIVAFIKGALFPTI